MILRMFGPIRINSIQIEPRWIADCSRRRAARLLQRYRSTLGKPALQLGPDACRRLQVVDSASTRYVGDF